MSETKTPERFGFVHVPLHEIAINPTLQLERDIQLIEWAEMLGFEEAWFGEHHSVGHEIIGTPEMLLAAAAQRTKTIRLGTGVVSVPYHHPFHVAERAVLLDHLTRGRAIIGVGPGSLTSDAHMLGIDVADSRRMLAEGLDVIVRLLEGEILTEETDWFKLVDARLQLNSFRRPRVELAAAAVASPSGARAAGRYGMGMINLAAMNPEAFEALRGHWEVVEHEAAKAGRPATRDGWRLSALMHLADTEEQAREDLRYGLVETLNYLGKISILPAVEGETYDEVLDSAIEQNVVTIGTYEKAIEVIESLAEQTGGFGCFCMTLIDYVPFAAQKRSLEIFAERVIPHFRDQLARRYGSKNWVLDDLGGGRKDWELAIVAATEAYQASGEAPGSRAVEAASQ